MRILWGILFGILMTATVCRNAHASEPAPEQPHTEPASAVYLPLIMEPHRLFLPVVHGRPPIDAPHPANAALRQSLNSYLTWEAVDPRLQGATYTIYLERDDATPDEAIVTGLTRMAYDPFTFEENTRYYWQVTATTGDGQQISGPVWSFTTDYFPETPEIDLMVEVPAGPFMMGCDDANNGGYLCSAVDTPLHEVYLDAYRIDKHEVTNKEYRACVEAGACNLPRKFGSDTRSSYFYNTDFDYFPVVYVSHWDAEDYCAWEGKRLPTEAEWEKAARGNVDTRPWPWGTEANDCTRANYYCFSPSDTERVDAFPRGQSVYGLMNVSGNVWEWVQDYYYDYYYHMTPYENPVLTESLQDDILPFFSVRGGCFRQNRSYQRTMHRKFGHWGDGVLVGTNDQPLFRSSIYGFRCAQSVAD